MPPAAALLPLPFTATKNLSLPNHVRLPSSRRSSLMRCQVAAPPATSAVAVRPSAAEVTRTIMELSRDGTLSASTGEGWPLGVGARFVVDAHGVPGLCLAAGAERTLELAGRSSFHVKLEQNGSRTPQCTLIGNLSKSDDAMLVRKLQANWEKKFEEKLDMELLYVLSVERVLHMEDFKEDGSWVSPSEYSTSNPDPLRDSAAVLVDEMNNKHADEVQRLCGVYVEMDPEFQPSSVKMIWVDRLGFDFHIQSQESCFEVRIPFPGEVSDVKGVKSAFNCMSHLAWEVDKNYVAADFDKVRLLKKIR